MKELMTYTKTIVQSIKMSTQTYNHDNATSEKCETCGQPMLMVENKHGRMLVCQDRNCGTRKNISKTTNSRCPNCHKKLEIVGEGDGQRLVCKCGYREKLTDFKERKQENQKQMNKREVQKYLASDDKKVETFNNPFAALLGDMDDHDA
jgi:DNA topoisomerase-3